MRPTADRDAGTSRPALGDVRKSELIEIPTTLGDLKWLSLPPTSRRSCRDEALDRARRPALKAKKRTELVPHGRRQWYPIAMPAPTAEQG